MLTVTKEKLHAAKTIYDIVPGDPKQEIVSYSSVSIRTFVDEQQTDIVEIGDRPGAGPGPTANCCGPWTIRAIS